MVLRIRDHMIDVDSGRIESGSDRDRVRVKREVLVCERQVLTKQDL